MPKTRQIEVCDGNGVCSVYSTINRAVVATGISRSTISRRLSNNSLTISSIRDKVTARYL